MGKRHAIRTETEVAERDKSPKNTRIRVPGLIHGKIAQLHDHVCQPSPFFIWEQGEMSPIFGEAELDIYIELKHALMPGV